MSVGYVLEDGIAVLTLDNPPVNALSQAVRAGLDAAMERAEAEARAVVVHGAGAAFIAGADISEFGKPPREPFLPQLCNRIEASPLPVVAAIHGFALGGGLEVALAAHYRVAQPNAKIGLPEVKLGILPGAGGTQRLPRLTGAEAALEIITSGRPIPASRAAELGVIDKLDDRAPREAGLDFARALLAQGKGPRPVSAMANPASLDFDEWATKAAKAARGEIAPQAAVRAVQAASELPFSSGLARERELFTNLMNSPQREGLVHAFFSERAVSKLPELKNVAPRPLQRIGVIGGGTMGGGIATACLLSGLEVALVERDAASAEKAAAGVAKNLDGAVKRGKLSASTRAALDGAFRAVDSYDALGDCDLVIEAVFEEMAVKKQVFAELDRVCKPGAILASNTSYLDVNEIAASTSRPADVIGLHFFSPAHVMKLLEIVVAEKTAPDVVATGFALAKTLGKIAVRAGVCDGFIGNRILAHWRNALDNAVLDGASPYAVDRALVAFGMAMGPYAVADLAGLDIGWATRKRKAPTRDPRARTPTYADRLCEMGRFGRKTGRGFYIYSEDAPRGAEDPEVLEIIESERAAQGVTPRDFGAEDIQRRFMCAMVNEGARVLEEGVARRPLDIDMTLLFGYGFPRWRGGPMKWADMQGLDTVLGWIKSYAEEDDWFWAPAPLLERLVAEDRSFDNLNKERAAS